MAGFKYFLKKWTPSTGRFIAENGKTVNIADVLRRQELTLDVFNNVRTVEYTPIVESKPTPGISLLRDRVEPADASAQVTTVGGKGNEAGAIAGDVPDISLPRDLIITLAVASRPGAGDYVGTLKLKEEF